MRKAFYCEEITFSGKFVPVIYYDELPTSSSNGKEGVRARRNIHDISDQIEGDEFQGSILSLQKLYNTSPPTPKKEKPMARPVSGYLSASGQFYDTEVEANFHDASSEFYETMREIVFEKFEPASSENATNIVDFMAEQIYKHKDIIKDFINTKETLLRNQEIKNDQLREPLEADAKDSPETPSERS